MQIGSLCLNQDELAILTLCISATISPVSSVYLLTIH